MVQSVEDQKSARVKKHLDDMVRGDESNEPGHEIGLSLVQRRIEEVEQRYYYATLGDKESNPFRSDSLEFLWTRNEGTIAYFSLGIAVRFPYGEFDTRTTDPSTEKTQTGWQTRPSLTFFRNSLL